MLNMFKKIRLKGILLGIALFAIQFGLYFLGTKLSAMLGTNAYAFKWKIPALDDLFPIVPFFAVIYLYAYFFWVCAPVAVYATKKRNLINYLCGYFLAILIGFVFFVFVPTYMDRMEEGLMDFAGRTGIFNRMLAFVYSADGGKIAYNLFPSYHCLVSTYSYLGIRKQEEISKGYKIYSLILAILICLSTLLTKQHYIVDLFSGVGIAIVCYILMNRLDPGGRRERKRAAVS